MYALFRRLLIVALIAGSACAGGCYHIKTGGPVTPPTGSTFSPGQPTPTPSGNCQSLDTTRTTIIVEVAPDINPTSVPTYGQIFGYAPAPPSGITLVSAVVHASTADVVQFWNISNSGEYSAVGLGSSGFPPVHHTFPSGTQNPVSSVIGSGTWSTGRLGVNSTSGCFSQDFTLSAGTWYFGDYDFYNLTNNRDVMIVTGGAQPRRVRTTSIILPARR